MQHADRASTNLNERVNPGWRLMNAAPSHCALQHGLSRDASGSDGALAGNVAKWQQAVDCRLFLAGSAQAGSHPRRPGRPMHSRNPRNPAPECCSAWDLDADRRSNLLLLLNMTGSKRRACSHCNALLLFTFYLAPAIRFYAGSHIVQLRAAQLGFARKPHNGRPVCCVTPEARRERDPEDCGYSGFGYRRL